MQQLLYLEVPTPDTPKVAVWLKHGYQHSGYTKIITTNGCIFQCPEPLSIFVWSLQRTTYLKAFWWSQAPVPPQVKNLLADLTTQIRSQFPITYPLLPELPIAHIKESIFSALSPNYPLTSAYFQKFPQGAYDLERVYWWEQRWRQSVTNPQTPTQVLFQGDRKDVNSATVYDLIYLGGGLGAIHGAMMAKLGYRVALVERLGFGRMNREWNISRQELNTLVEFGLFTWAELTPVITREYVDGFNKFFDGNNPPHLKAPVLHTPLVLNLALDTSKLLTLCGEKLRQYGADIYEYHEFQRLYVSSDRAVAEVKSLKDNTVVNLSGRLAIDAMGSASLISQQLNGGKAFDSVSPTVGAVVDGFEPKVWDYNYGDVLHSHGDISRGRQLIWELFPGEGTELTIYLFHYHQVHPKNPGSLLDMYEDFFAILPEYRACDPQRLQWKKPTFGYIPAYFAVGQNSRQGAADRLLAIGDASAVQSPLVFTGFGSLVRNLPRLTKLLDLALKHNLLSGRELGLINAYQSNIAVTWLFSKGMMVPTGAYLPPQRINSMLNTFFGTLAQADPSVSDRFIKDRIDWWMFNKLALQAAVKNPALIAWIWEMAGTKDMVRWLSSYGEFAGYSLQKAIFGKGLAAFLAGTGKNLEKLAPASYLRLLSYAYSLGI